MQLYRATALVAAVLIILLTFGYAADEHVEEEQEFSGVQSEDSPS